MEVHVSCCVGITLWLLNFNIGLTTAGKENRKGTNKGVQQKAKRSNTKEKEGAQPGAKQTKPKGTCIKELRYSCFNVILIVYIYYYRESKKRETPWDYHCCFGTWGQQSGQTATNSAGQQSGQSATNSAGQQSGQSATNSAGQQSGQSATNSAGQQSGQSATNSAGQQSGQSATNSAGQRWCLYRHRF